MTTEPSLTLLDPTSSDEAFPPVEMAWEEPNGLLAVGGDLSPQRLSNAYNAGIFPWFNENEPIYWWSPDPRAVLFPTSMQISRSLRKTARNKNYRISFDEDFSETVLACASPRAYSSETWITSGMHKAYCQLHKLGKAHSVEVRDANNELVGGLYGVVSRGVFSGESMFSTERDTSKLALLALAAHLHTWGYTLIDCQLVNAHLLSLGAEGMSRQTYIKQLRKSPIPIPHQWQVIEDLDLSRWNRRTD
ncbi:MAG: leucyl/phenylalanyl-tRNA--protein transferase [Thiotrichaceae bacterium]